MKRILSVATAVAMLFASCANNDELPQSAFVAPSEDFIASVGSEVRTSLDGTAVVWNEEDLLTIFTKTSHNRQYKVKNIADGGRTATFGYVSYTGSDNTAIAENYAVYPYDANAALVNGVVATSLSATQLYNATNGDISYALMVAKSANNNLAFENAGALMRFKVKSVIPDTFTLKAIKVASANNNIAGDVTIDLNGEESKAVAATTGVKEITLTDINTVVADEEKVFYVAMLATNFGENDLTVTFSFEEGDKVFTLPAFNLAQGKIKSVAYNIADTDDFTGTTPGVGDATDEPETPAGPANNEIWYTNGGATSATEPYTSYGFGATVISNTYDVDKKCWVIKFDGDVTAIGRKAFYECSNLKTVTLPNTVASIGEEAFASAGITSINIPSAVTSIDEYAFDHCLSLTRVDVTDLESWCKITFRDDGVGGSGTYANPLYYGDLYIDEKKVTDLTIPSTITVVKPFAFCGSSIESVNLPEGIVTIGQKAFASCSSLTEVTIASSVSTIGWRAFNSCTNLEKVVCLPTTPPAVTLWNNTDWAAFTSTSSNMKIYVPANSVSDYESYRGWVEYKYNNIIVAIE